MDLDRIAAEVMQRAAPTIARVSDTAASAAVDRAPTVSMQPATVTTVTPGSADVQVQTDDRQGGPIPVKSLLERPLSVGDRVMVLFVPPGGAFIVGVPTGPDIVHTVGITGEPAFQNSWLNQGGGSQGAQFWKDAEGIVHLVGLLTKATTPAGGETIFTLPSGYRPAATLKFAAVTSASAGTVTMASIDITTAGAVQYSAGGMTAGRFLSLNGITFLASGS